jgi:hypothetical protein
VRFGVSLTFSYDSSSQPNEKKVKRDKIPYNQPTVTGKEIGYIRQAIEEYGCISGTGHL